MQKKKMNNLFILKEKNGDIKMLTILEKVGQFLKNIEKDNQAGKKINAILQINNNAIEEAKEIEKKIKVKKAGRLAGYIFAIKANINVKSFNINCASRVLENYKAPYDATVIEKIKKEDGVIIGIANMDEFACGSSGETSAFGLTKNPRALDRIPGGSSSGSAAAVAIDFCDVSLGSDTGGSIRNPTSHCGIVGFKPSYGTVSRYGLIDLAMSFDQIGPLAKNVDDAKLVFDVISGKDERDPTTLSSMSLKEKEREKLREKQKSKIKIAIPEVISDTKILQLIEKKINSVCEMNGFKFDRIKLKYVDLAIQTYYPICYVEFFSATRKFDGRRYGKKIEEYCGEEVLRRILGGSEISKEEYRGKYYRAALKVRGLIKNEIDKVFKDFDVIAMPTVPKLPHKIGEKLSVYDMYAYDSLTVLANLASIPSISIPAGRINEIPVGLQLMAGYFNDYFLFDIAKIFEKNLMKK